MIRAYWNSEHRPGKRVILLHSLCWSVYITYELGLLWYATGRLEKPWVYLMFYSINIVFFYGFSSLLKVTFDRPEKKYVSALLKLSGLILAYLALKLMANYVTAPGSTAFPDPFRDPGKFIANTLFRAGYFIMLAIFYWAAGHVAYFRRQAAEAERGQILARAEKADLEVRYMIARNALLHQQINPHLMFNALNFVYSRVLHTSPEAGRCLVLLTDILRFGLDATAPDNKTLLEEELLQIENLLEINRYRFDGALYIDIDLDGDLTGKGIIPLILLTLTENVFKHGDLTDPGHPAQIKLTLQNDGNLYFTTRNLVKAKTYHARKSQSGLDNIRIRLEHAYTMENFTLQYGQVEEYFEVNLKISV